MAIPRRPFGRTGHRSSAVIFGAAALRGHDQATADHVLDLLLEYGVNHIDTAAAYGESEDRIGPWMDRHRKDFFLATKTGDRSYETAKASIHRSLERLRTDHVDLIQLHSLAHPVEWEQALSPGGALDACIEAREAGLARFIGVTGHGWTIAAMHKKALERFAFDAVLMPWNWFCSQKEPYASDFAATRALCRERGVAVQTIKALARGPWAASVPRSHTTWYQPLTDPADITEAVHWLLGQGDDLFLNSVGDVTLLPAVFRAAEGASAGPDAAVMGRFAERTGLASIFGI